MRRGLFALGFCVLLSAPGAALAGWPDDINIDNLRNMNGCDHCEFSSTDVPLLRQQYYQAVAQDLMVLASPHISGPAETTGTWGFDIGLDYTFVVQRRAFPNRANGELATGWEAMAESGDPAPSIHSPMIKIRKGLPMSFELEGGIGWLAQSRQTMAVGRVKWAFQEGTPPMPDIAVGYGYGAYLGNPQLDVGAHQWDIAFGWTVPVGINGRYNGARWSPWFGYGITVGHSLARRYEPGLLVSPKLTGFLGRGDDNISTGDYRFHKLILGMRMVSGLFQFSVASDLVVDSGNARPFDTGASTITLRAGMLF